MAGALEMKGTEVPLWYVLSNYLKMNERLDILKQFLNKGHKKKTLSKLNPCLCVCFRKRDPQKDFFPDDLDLQVLELLYACFDKASRALFTKVPKLKLATVLEFEYAICRFGVNPPYIAIHQQASNTFQGLLGCSKEPCEPKPNQLMILSPHILI